MQLVLVKLNSRTHQAVKFQEVLTKHGCNISMRLGLHEFSNAACSDEGVILLQVKQEEQAVKTLTADLLAIGNVEVKTVSL
jgi:hypothetical protein